METTPEKPKNPRRGEPRDPRVSPPRVLRIGLLVGEDIVDARIVPRAETVFVGTSDECHFEVRSRRLPEPKFALFEIDEAGYVLRFTESMDGRVGLKSGVKGFEELRTSKEVEVQEGVCRLRLPRSARGKVIIGGTTILFELVDAPPETSSPSAQTPVSRARTGLPPGVRAPLFADVDWYFTGFVVSTFLLFFVGFIFLETYDPIVDDDPEMRSERYARFIFDEPPPPAPPPEELETEESEEAEEAERAEPEPVRRAPRETSSAPASEERRASLTREIGHQVESAVMGAVSEIQGSLGDALAAGLDMRVSAADAIAQAQGIGVADGQAGSILAREGGTGSGSGERGNLGALAGGESGGGRTIATRQVAEQQVRGRVGLAGGGITGGSGAFDDSVVRQMIARRIRAIRACYERSLRQNPNAAGRVVVRFTIEQSGAVSGANAVENSTGDAAVGSCVVETVRRFRFSPGPSGGSVTVTFPFVFAPQG